MLGSLLEVWHTTTPGKADFKGSASEVRAATPSRVILMRTHEERILRILGKAVEPLLTSEITERLNHEVGGKERYTIPLALVRRCNSTVVLYSREALSYRSPLEDRGLERRLAALFPVIPKKKGPAGDNNRAHAALHWRLRSKSELI